MSHISLLVVGALLSAACGGAAASPAATPLAAPLPTGFTRYTGSDLGFEMALAPGWTEAGKNPQSGVSFTGPNGAVMLIHVERAVSTVLAATAGAVLFDLTHGDGVTDSQQAEARLAGRPARRTSGRFAVAGTAEAIVAYVMLESGRAWAVALAGTFEQVEAVRDGFERMVGSFRLVGPRPSPPPRAAAGLPAPGFAELDEIKGAVVINFFATWCTDCRIEMPLLAKRAASSQGRFTLLGVDCCNDSPSAVGGFLNGMGVRAAFGYLAYDVDGHLGRAYGLIGPPTTFFVDRNHVLRHVVIGQLSSATLEQGLKAAGAA